MKRSAARAALSNAGATRDPEHPPTPVVARWRRVLPLAAIVALGLLAYSNAFHGEFVFDDGPGIQGNRLVQDLGSWIGSWEGYRATPNRWVGNLTFALNYRFGDLDPTGYHAVNVAIHLLNALLVHALVLISFRTPWLRRSALAPSARAVALVAALLFVAHPLQTQAVTYVVQRFASLATTFYLAAIVLYARWRLARDAGGARGVRGIAGYVAVVVAAVLAMKTKEIAFTLPMMVAFYEISFFEGPWRKRLAFLAPVLATLAVVPLALLSVHKPVGEILSDVTEVTKVETAMSRLDYLRTQVVVIGTYLRLLVLPVGQNLDYDHPIYRSFLAPRVLLSGTVLAALAALALAAWGAPFVRSARARVEPGARLAAFGIAWFFVALSVESSIIPIVDVIFEHRVYLPSVGVFVAVATAGALLARRVAPARSGVALVSAGAALAVVLAAGTFLRNRVWATELSLWTDVVAKSPAKSRPHDSLGLALAKRGREPEAIAEFEEAIRLDPSNVKARNNLGVALAKLGRVDEALASFDAALRIRPDHAEAWYNLGRMKLMIEGRYAEAAALFQKALALRRDYPEAYANLGATWNAMGRYAETRALLEDARPIIRRQPHAHFNLGLAQAALGDRAAAEGEIRLLQGLSPDLAAQLRDAIAGLRRVP